jgi:hypothetical protein
VGLEQRQHAWGVGDVADVHRLPGRSKQDAAGLLRGHGGSRRRDARSQQPSHEDASVHRCVTIVPDRRHGFEAETLPFEHSEIEPGRLLVFGRRPAS